LLTDFIRYSITDAKVQNIAYTAKNGSRQHQGSRWQIYFFSQNEIFFKKIILFFGTIATNHYLWGVLIIIW